MSCLIQLQLECDIERTASWIRKNTKESPFSFLSISNVISLALHWNGHEGLMNFIQDTGTLPDPLILPFITDPWVTEA